MRRGLISTQMISFGVDDMMHGLISTQLMAQVGDVDDATRELLARGIEQIPLAQLVGIVVSAQQARAQLDRGDMAGALETLAPYEQLAREAGLGLLWDQLAAQLGLGG